MQGIQRQIVLTKPQVAWIEARAKKLGISQAEVIRRTIDEIRETK